jgi:hypothetical protein
VDDTAGRGPKGRKGVQPHAGTNPWVSQPDEARRAERACNRPHGRARGRRRRTRPEGPKGHSPTRRRRVGYTGNLVPIISPQGSARTRQDRGTPCLSRARGVARTATVGEDGNHRRTPPDAIRFGALRVPAAPSGRWGKNAGMPPTPASFVGRGYALSAPGGASIPPDSAESPKSRSRRALRMIGGREIREARRQSRPEGPEGRSPTRRRRVGSSFREYPWSAPRRRVPGEKGAAGGGLGDTAAGSAASPIRWSTPHRSRVREAKTTAGQRICRSWCDRVADQTGPPKYRAAV